MGTTPRCAWCNNIIGTFESKVFDPDEIEMYHNNCYQTKQERLNYATEFVAVKEYDPNWLDKFGLLKGEKKNW